MIWTFGIPYGRFLLNGQRVQQDVSFELRLGHLVRNSRSYLKYTNASLRFLTNYFMSRNLIHNDTTMTF